MASESEKKFDEISRRLGVVQEVRILLLMLILLVLEKVPMLSLEIMLMLQRVGALLMLAMMPEMVQHTGAKDDAHADT